MVISKIRFWMFFFPFFFFNSCSPLLPFNLLPVPLIMFIKVSWTIFSCLEYYWSKINFFNLFSRFFKLIHKYILEGVWLLWLARNLSKVKSHTKMSSFFIYEILLQILKIVILFRDILWKYKNKKSAIFLCFFFCWNLCIQWAPENSGIEIGLLDSSYDFMSNLT